MKLHFYIRHPLCDLGDPTNLIRIIQPVQPDEIYSLDARRDEFCNGLIGLFDDKFQEIR